MTHSTYTFVLCYWDPAMLFVGLLRIDATAASAEHASREIEESKHNRDWLFSAFKAAGLALDEEDIDGVSIGEHVLLDPNNPPLCRPTQDACKEQERATSA